MLKIWGRVNSVNVKKALWAAEELGLKYERIDAGMQFGVSKTPEYLKMNPNSLVPTIDDDGFVLWESHAIVRYLAAKHGAGTLWPADLQGARRRRALDGLGVHLPERVPCAPVFWGLIRTPPEKRDMKAIEEGGEEVRRAAGDPRAQALESKPYVAGDSAHHGRHPARLPRAALDARADRAPEAARTSRLVRAPVRSAPAFRKIVDIPLS